MAASYTRVEVEFAEERRARRKCKKEKRHTTNVNIEMEPMEREGRKGWRRVGQ